MIQSLKMFIGIIKGNSDLKKEDSIKNEIIYLRSRYALLRRDFQEGLILKSQYIEALDPIIESSFEMMEIQFNKYSEKSELEPIKLLSNDTNIIGIEIDKLLKLHSSNDNIALKNRYDRLVEFKKIGKINEELYDVNIRGIRKALNEIDDKALSTDTNDKDIITFKLKVGNIPKRLILIKKISLSSELKSRLKSIDNRYEKLYSKRKEDTQINQGFLIDLSRIDFSLLTLVDSIEF